MQTTTAPSWQALAFHAQELKNTTMKELFACDGQRFEAMSIEAAGILCDFSKNLMTEKTLELLLQLAREMRPCRLDRADVFRGTHQQHRESPCAAHGPAQALEKRPAGRRHKISCRGCRACLRKCAAFQKPCAAAPGRAIREGRLPISSISVSAGQISGRPWLPRPSRPMAGAIWPCILYPISTARISPKPCAG